MGKTYEKKKGAEMKIILCDNNENMIYEWERVFSNRENINCILGDYCKTAENENVDALVSPANSFGIMDGGLDLYIQKFYLKNNINIQDLVQEEIKRLFYGIQTVGSSIFIKNDFINLIHTPTMKVPGQINDLNAIYFATRNTIICARENGVKKIIIPAFGAGIGNIKYSIVARIMEDAITSLDLNYFKDWKYVNYLFDKEFI